MKYIVMECLNSCAVLLDEEGRFVKAANLRYQVGQTVTDPVLLQPPRPKHSGRWARLVGALAACLTLAAGLLLYQTFFAVYATVTLRAGAEVSIELNRLGHVLAVKPGNGDGFTLLDGYGKPDEELEDTAEELLDRAMSQGFLAEGDTVTVLIDAPRQELFQHYGILLRSEITDHLDGKAELAIYAADEAPVDPAPPAGDGTVDDDHSDDDDDDDDDDPDDDDDDPDDDDDDDTR